MLFLQLFPEDTVPFGWIFRLMCKAQKSPKTRLIFAGKLSEKKGVMSLLRALSHLNNPQDYELALAGGYGNQAEYDEICRLAEAAPCEVSFLGKLTHQQLAQQMNASDIFILPSFFEGLPLVLIEAMACGTRVICSDLPGIQPWLEKAIPGSGVVFVTPPEMQNEDEPLPESLPIFEKALAEAIVTVMDNPLADQNLVKSVSWDALCGKLIGIFEK
jgi:glycosyltransferase involved in cell wall biosynthesis